MPNYEKVVLMPDLDRRKVTLTNYVFTGNGEDGQPLFQKHEATDHVDVDHIDAYVADAKKRWASVVVGDETDHGPDGAKGAYTVKHLGIGE